MDIDSLKRSMNFSFTIKLMVITPIVFFIFNLIVLNIIYSEILKESVFGQKNMIYHVVFVFMILWAIYLAIDFQENPNRIYLFSGVFCLIESIFFLANGVHILYFLLGKSGIVYIAIGIGVYLANFIFNAFLAYLFIKKKYSEEDKKITRVRVFSIILIFASAIIFNISINSEFHNINLLYPNLVDPTVLTYSTLNFALSHLIVIGTINIYKYISIKK
ncbi:hypothetical protein [Clostridium sp. LIBA-8841]|uniref:hypothetical protein n=1 Tax=Clostridium sp. LIBA-8841 TaxID=2987530 RepID=UPI002AC4B7CB|nr:hypothetical protein [Clostridium sp. LIBA-8841]MDZ5253757.1 hypothetical protein [Clostridium sp. LIBA-8841]